ncbi:hypothetical protein D3C86_1780440 [compost metagenome]
MLLAFGVTQEVDLDRVNDTDGVIRSHRQGLGYRHTCRVIFDGDDVEVILQPTQTSNTNTDHVSACCGPDVRLQTVTRHDHFVQAFDDRSNRRISEALTQT